MKRRAWLAGGVSLAAVAGGIGLARWKTSSGARDDVASGLWRLRFDKPAGGELVMAELRGRPLLLNFWATWCAPCIREMPLLDRFFRAQAANGWQVAGLAVDSPAPVLAYLQRLPMAFPIALAGADGVALTRELGNASGGLPFSVVFAASGHVLERHLGALEPADLERLVRSRAG